MVNPEFDSGFTISDAGTINAAAKKLYVSQQSLSKHIRKLEKELGVQLFIRENPLQLTDAGKAFYQMSEEILASQNRFKSRLHNIQASKQESLIIGCLGYGTPDFLPELISKYMLAHPNAVVQAKEFRHESDIPSDIHLLISTNALTGYHNEKILEDAFAICVSDELLKREYGNEWESHQKALLEGNLSAIRECPFIHHRNEKYESSVFDTLGITPTFLAVSGGDEIRENLCRKGQAAMIVLLKQVDKKYDFPPAYRIANIPQDKVPACYICYKTLEELPEGPLQFLEIVRRFFSGVDWG